MLFNSLQIIYIAVAVVVVAGVCIKVLLMMIHVVA